MSKALACVLLFAVLAAGCAAKTDVRTAATATNGTASEVTLLVKAWDHNGAIVLNKTVQLAPGAHASLGTVTGPAPSYGAEYSWFALAGTLQQQVKHSPEGVASWSVTVLDDRIAFEFTA